MGTYINLSILSSNILNLEWEQVYDESLKLVNAFPFADVAEREFFGYKLFILKMKWAILNSLRNG